MSRIAVPVYLPMRKLYNIPGLSDGGCMFLSWSTAWIGGVTLRGFTLFYKWDKKKHCDHTEYHSWPTWEYIGLNRKRTGVPPSSAHTHTQKKGFSKLQLHIKVKCPSCGLCIVESWTIPWSKERYMCTSARKKVRSSSVHLKHSLTHSLSHSRGVRG